MRELFVKHLSAVATSLGGAAKAAFLTIAFYPLFVVGAEFEYVNVNPANGAPYSKPTLRTLVVTGEFLAGDSRRLINLIASDPDQFLRVNTVLVRSPGGDLGEAIAIAEIFKNSYKVVNVSGWFGPCISACFYLVAAAVQREILDGQIGLHRPYLPSDLVHNSSLSDLERSQLQAYERVKVQLQSYGVPVRLVETMLSRASNEMYWLNMNDKRLLGKRAPWFEQILVSRCNLNKTLEDRYFSQFNPGLDGALEQYVNGLIDCQWRVVGNAPQEYVIALLAKLRRER
jgi:hypothetical protein